MAKYKIVSKTLNGINVASYTVKSTDDETKRLSVQDTISMARLGDIDNVEAVLNTETGEYILYFKYGESSIPIESRSNVLTPIARVFENGNCIGYKVIDKNGKQYKLSTNKVWQMAIDKQIYGIKAKLINGKRAIISGEIDIKTLNKIQ